MLGGEFTFEVLFDISNRRKGEELGVGALELVPIEETEEAGEGELRFMLDPGELTELTQGGKPCEKGL